MRKKSFVLAFSLFMCVFYSCVENNELDLPLKMSIYNYSDSAVYVYATCEDSIQAIPELKLFENNTKKGDDSLTNKRQLVVSWCIADEYIRNRSTKHKELSLYSPGYRANAYSDAKGIINVSDTNRGCRLNCKEGKLYLFFIKENTIRTRTWEEIVQGQLYTARIVKTEEELNKEGWKILYDPNSLVPR